MRFAGQFLLALALTCPLPGRAADDPTLLREGWRRYHAGCNHCHGPDGAGSTIAPSLVAALPERERFMRILADGVSGRMPAFAADPNVAPWAEAIFGYLEARAQGRLGRGRPPG